SGMTASGAQKGTYLAWLRGNATAPYNSRQHDSLVTITVAGQQKDFNLASTLGIVAVGAPGTQADFPVKVRDNSGSTSWNGGANSVKLTWEQCPTNIDPLTGIPLTLVCKINGSAATSFVNVSVGSGSSVEATFNVDTTTAITDRTYSGWIRGFGRDAASAGGIEAQPSRESWKCRIPSPLRCAFSRSCRIAARPRA